MGSRAKCEVNLLINSCLAFWKMAGVPDNARDMVRRAAVHDMAVRSMGTVRSQWLPQACWLELWACDKTGTMFPYSDFQKFDCYVRDLLHFDFVVFASVRHAPDKMFGEHLVLGNNDDVLPYKSIEKAFIVSGLTHHRSTKKAKAASDTSPEFFIPMPEPFCTRHNLSG